MGHYSPRSFAWRKVLSLALWVCWGTGIGMILFYAIALWQGDAWFTTYSTVRESMVVAFPFVVIILLFLAALWTYTLYVDLSHLFPRFRFSPLQALWNVFLPIINIYGIGLTFVRIINALDHYESDDNIYAKGYRMKLALAAFYAGLMGSLIMLFFSNTMPEAPELQHRATVVVFHFTEIITLLFAISGFMWMVRANTALLKYRISQ